MPRRRPESRAVEIDERDRAVCIEQHVVRVEVGVPDTRVVKPAYDAPDFGPIRHGQPLLAEPRGERETGTPHDDEVGAIPATISDGARGDRTRRRQLKFL